MAWTDINAGDHGWVAKLRIVEDGGPVDLSSFTTRQMIFRSPTGATVTKVASFDSNGQDGLLRYVVQSGDIAVPGLWHVQARVAKTGAEITSAALPFEVEERL